MTNTAARKALGEAGFLEQAEIAKSSGYIVTRWMRNNQQLYLHEPHEGMAGAQPYLTQSNGVPIAFDRLGVRNENIQQDGSPDE